MYVSLVIKRHYTRFLCGCGLPSAFRARKVGLLLFDGNAAVAEPDRDACLLPRLLVVIAHNQGSEAVLGDE
jgi:hypothetical protein